MPERTPADLNLSTATNFAISHMWNLTIAIKGTVDESLSKHAVAVDLPAAHVSSIPPHLLELSELQVEFKHDREGIVNSRVFGLVGQAVTVTINLLDEWDNTIQQYVISGKAISTQTSPLSLFSRQYITSTVVFEVKTMELLQTPQPT